MELLDQLPTLLGVAIGAAGSYAATTLTERARWRRMRAERWDEKKFAVYTSYANALKNQIWIVQRIGAAMGFAHVVDPLEPAEGLERLAQAEGHRATEWESVLLVGDAETIAAARSWHEAVWAFAVYVRDLSDDQEGWTRASQRLSQARDAFYACARSDLGIAGPLPPSGNWPRTWQRQGE